MIRNSRLRPSRLHRVVSDYSSLERRELLAGDVSAVFRGGHLRISGDQLANEIRIVQIAADHVRVSGTSTSLNGGGGSLDFRGTVRQLTMDLKGGNDSVVLNGLRLAGRLSLKGGAGNDILRLADVQARDCQVDSGAGDDTIEIDGVRTSGTTGVQLPKGNDVVAISNLTTGRDLRIRSGGTATVSTGVLNVGQNLGASFSGGDDRLVLCDETTVAGRTAVRLGSGNDFFGAVPERVGETVRISGRLSVDGGKGDDLVCLDQATLASGGARVDGRAGTDTLLDSPGTTVRRSVERLTDEQPNLQFRQVMETLTDRGLAAGTFGAAQLNVDPVTQFVTVNDRTPTISAQWDDAAQAAVVALQTGPTIASRAYAMLHTAMYDAWSAYDGPARSTQLADALQRPAAENTEANKRVAMSYAAYRVLADLFPSQIAGFDSLMSQLGLDPANQSTDSATPAGIGNVMAARLLEFRHADGSNQLGTDSRGTAGVPYSDTSGYVPVNSPDNLSDISAWTPERVPIDAAPGTEDRIQSYLTPHWGTVTPFALTSGNQLRPAFDVPFLLVDGATVDYAARTITLADSTVLNIGRNLVGTIINPRFLSQFEELVTVSANLTDEQKLIAEFWEDGGGTSFPPGTWMSFGQYVSARDNHSLDDDARMFFALGNAVLDAGIATWEAKRFYNYARPVRAIRELGRLGLIGEFDPVLGGYAINAWVPGRGTQRILATQWLTYQTPGGDPSPPFPDFSSGHSAFSASAAEVLRSFTGSDTFGARVTFQPGESRFEPGLTPSQSLTLAWPTFTAAALEACKSRIYGGIHFEAANELGTRLGTLVGSAVWNRAQQFMQGGV